MMYIDDTQDMYNVVDWWVYNSFFVLKKYVKCEYKSE